MRKPLTPTRQFDLDRFDKTIAIEKKRYGFIVFKVEGPSERLLRHDIKPKH